MKLKHPNPACATHLPLKRVIGSEFYFKGKLETQKLVHRTTQHTFAFHCHLLVDVNDRFDSVVWWVAHKVKGSSRLFEFEVVSDDWLHVDGTRI